MLVYDVTNQASFDNLHDWLDLVRKHTPSDPAKMPHLALLANKREGHAVLPLAAVGLRCSARGQRPGEP